MRMTVLLCKHTGTILKAKLKFIIVRTPRSIRSKVVLNKPRWKIYCRGGGRHEKPRLRTGKKTQFENSTIGWQTKRLTPRIKIFAPTVFIVFYCDSFKHPTCSFCVLA